MNASKSALKTSTKHHIVTALIIVAVIILAGLFGTLLVESKAQAFHAVSGTYKYNKGGIVFLCSTMSAVTLFVCYFVTIVRNDDLTIKLNRMQPH